MEGDDPAWERLIAHYRGNPLALNIAGETIVTLFGGRIAGFVEQAPLVFGGIRQLLDEQVNRLSPLERTIANWLAVEREPVKLVDLADDLGSGIARGDVLEAVAALHRRSLLEQGEPGQLHPAACGPGVCNWSPGRCRVPGDPDGGAFATRALCAGQGTGA